MRGRRSPASSIDDDRGFLTIDAIVGLGIVVLGVIGIIQAQSQMLSMMKMAMETRRTLAEAEFQLESQWPKLRRPGEVAGSDGDLNWALSAVEATPIKTSPMAICRVTSEAWIASSRRRLAIHTQSICKGGAA